MKKSVKKFLDTDSGLRDFTSTAALDTICDLLNRVTGGVRSLMNKPRKSCCIFDRAARDVFSIECVSDDKVRISKQIWDKTQGAFEEHLRCYAVVTGQDVRYIMGPEAEQLADAQTMRHLFATLSWARDDLAAKQAIRVMG